MRFRRVCGCIFGLVLTGMVCAARGQTMLKVTAGWGDAMRLGRWTPVFISVADPRTRDVDLQIHGSYGEKSLAVCVHQTAVAQPRPTTYALLFPVNAQPSRIVVIVSDEKTGKTLATEALQNPDSFLPAGQVPKRLLGPRDFLAGISGEIGDALRLRAQLDRAGLAGGILDPIKLPANFVGYDGISVLILVAADFAELKPEQELAILQWVRGGGNLVVIPGTAALPVKSVLMDALPCDVGVNRLFGKLNGRELSPRAGAVVVRVMDENGYEHRVGFGDIAVLPDDVAPVQFESAEKANEFWHSVLGGVLKVPGIEATTEMPLSEEQDVLISGPNAADSVGRGARETVAIRHVLELLGATGSRPSVDWRGAMLLFAGLFFLIGPVDSVILFRLGQRPRSWVTVVGWIGLLASVGAFASVHVVGRPGESAPTVESLRLVDQIGDSTVAAVDIVAVKSERSGPVKISLDEKEWWEPANQAARSFGRDRFVDVSLHEDQEGCRPDWVRLVEGEGQAFRGEAAQAGPGWVRAKLGLRKDAAGNEHLVGTVTNAGASELSDIQVETAAGNFRIGKLIAAGATMNVDEAVGGGAIGSGAIGLGGLPGDVGDVSVDRADVIEGLVKHGFGCVYCRVTGAGTGRWQVLRVVVELGK